MTDERPVLGFSLAAMRRLADPEFVLDDARQWAVEVGIVTDRPPHVLTKFQRDHHLRNDFPVEPAPAVETLEHMREHFDAVRYVHVGAGSADRERVEDAGWEYQSVAEAASAAGWELSQDDEEEEATASGPDRDDWP